MAAARTDECEQTNSRLLELPTEIRLAIYSILVSPHSERFLDLRLQPRQKNAYVSLTMSTQLTRLSLVCRQIKSEISQSYPLESLTLRPRPGLSWSSIPGPDPKVFVNVEPLQDYFLGVTHDILSSKEAARRYLDFLRDNDDMIAIPDDHKSIASFPQPADAYDYPHPQFSLILTALSVYPPVNTMFQRVTKLEICEELIAPRYPYLFWTWVDRVLPNLRFLNLLHYQIIAKYESIENWGDDLDVEWWKLCPDDETYGWLKFGKQLHERGIEMLWTALCEYQLRCRDPQYKDAYEEPYFETHVVFFLYTYEYQKNEIVAVELESSPQKCVCKYDIRFRKEFYASMAKEGLQIKDGIIDDLILDMLGKRDCIPLSEDAGWDRPINCAVLSRG